MPFELPSTLSEYIDAHTTPPSGDLVALEAETRESTSAPQMLTGLVEGRFLETLAFTTNAKNVLEIGTFTGYSALSMAEALPPGGRIVTCDISEDHVAIARRHIDASPHRDRIDIRVGPAIDTLKGLDGPFDLAFIDADKTGYLGYYEAIVPKLAPGGVIAVDNVLWSGRVLDGSPPDEADESTRALREFNDHVVADERVECVMLPLRDGVTLVRLRAAG